MKAMANGWIRSLDWSLYRISESYRVMRSKHFDYHEIHLLTYLCNDVIKSINNWKHLSKRELKKVFLKPSLKPSGRYIYLKPSGRYLVAKYVLTKDLKYLKRLGFSHLLPRFSLVGSLSLTELESVRTVRRNPLTFIRQPDKRKIISYFRKRLYQKVFHPIILTLSRRYYSWRISK